ncbi:hypothetical protein [Hyphomicrobium sp.]|uniref:hypothetical protein n=1 Tax=Hyphomicrobium sp. TaxID=82 RepID=UPI002E380AFA|nr:hypothetical protein [Hyphomicrobium sp.]HEX2841805.1 hypothetical protein [Hyphomicrobium sp.]
MKKRTALSVAMAALLALTLGNTPSIANDDPPADQGATATDASAPSGEAIPAEPAASGEEKPAE